MEVSTEGILSNGDSNLKPAIIDVAPPKVGASNQLSFAEIAIEVGRLADNVRKEWDSLRPDDVVYLLAIQGQGAGGASNDSSPHCRNRSSFG